MGAAPLVTTLGFLRTQPAPATADRTNRAETPRGTGLRPDRATTDSAHLATALLRMLDDKAKCPTLEAVTRTRATCSGLRVRTATSPFAETEARPADAFADHRHDRLKFLIRNTNPPGTLRARPSLGLRPASPETLNALLATALCPSESVTVSTTFWRPPP